MTAAHVPVSVSAADRRLAAVEAVDLFSVLPPEDSRRLASALLERNYPAGAPIVHADDPSGGPFFIVAEGEVAVLLETGEGKETVLATLQPGEYFGEMSLIDESPRAATARAVRPSRLMLLRREDFRRLMSESPRLCLALLEEMNRRLRLSNRKVAGLSYRSMRCRVAGALVTLMEEKGLRKLEDGAIRVIIRERPTRKFLAEMAGTTRESASRTLAAWEREGWVKAQGRDLVILREEALRALVG